MFSNINLKKEQVLKDEKHEVFNELKKNYNQLVKMNMELNYELTVYMEKKGIKVVENLNEEYFKNYNKTNKIYDCITPLITSYMYRIKNMENNVN